MDIGPNWSTSVGRFRTSCWRPGVTPCDRLRVESHQRYRGPPFTRSVHLPSLGAPAHTAWQLPCLVRRRVFKTMQRETCGDRVQLMFAGPALYTLVQQPTGQHHQDADLLDGVHVTCRVCIYTSSLEPNTFMQHDDQNTYYAFNVVWGVTHMADSVFSHATPKHLVM